MRELINSRVFFFFFFFKECSSFLLYLILYLFHSSRGMVRYLARGDVSTNDGHRHGCGKIVRKEVHRWKYIHLDAAYDSKEGADPPTFFMRVYYRYVFLLLIFFFFSFTLSNVIVHIYIIRSDTLCNLDWKILNVHSYTKK